MSAAPLATLERDGDVAIVTLENPPVGALSVEFLAQLRDVLAAAAGERLLVMRSALPAHFGVGADLKLLDDASSDTFAAYLEQVRDTIALLVRVPLSIAAIDGYALGGGLELALACTFRFVGRKARMGLPEITLGLLPGAGGTQRLTQLIGRDRALEMMLTGRRLGPHEAVRIGLASRLVEIDPATAAIAFARSLADRSADAIAAIVRCVDAAVPYAHAAGMDVEAEQMRAVFDTPGAREGVRAFLDGRRSAPAGRSR